MPSRFLGRRAADKVIKYKFYWRVPSVGAQFASLSQSEERFCIYCPVYLRKYHMCNSESSSPGFCHTETHSCWLAASLRVVLEKWYWLSSFKAVTAFVFLHLSCSCRTLSCFDRDVDRACPSILTYRFDPARRNKAFWCYGAAVRLKTIFSLEGSICQHLGRRKASEIQQIEPVQK